MKKLFLLFLLILKNHPSEAQMNLVPNPSFEDTIACPVNISGQYGDEIYKLTNWFPAGESPDYFNSCAPVNQSTGQASVPYNGLGFQYSHSGEGYIGLITALNSPLFANYREYIGVQLVHSLNIGITYYYHMNVSCAFGGWQNIGVFSNKLGIKLSNVQYNSQFNPLYPVNQCTAYSDSIITDTTNWTEMSFQFVADSSYTYLYLGNFFDAQHTDTLLLFGQGAYYYIDDICLSDDSTCTTTSNLNNNLAYSNKTEIFPNPISTLIYIKSKKKNKFYVYNNLGQVVYENYVEIGVNENDLSTLSKGFYFIKFEDDLSQVFKIIKI